jgi:hypothetical protein
MPRRLLVCSLSLWFLRRDSRQRPRSLWGTRGGLPLIRTHRPIQRKGTCLGGDEPRRYECLVQCVHGLSTVLVSSSDGSSATDRGPWSAPRVAAEIRDALNVLFNRAGPPGGTDAAARALGHRESVSSVAIERSALAKSGGGLAPCPDREGMQVAVYGDDLSRPRAASRAPGLLSSRAWRTQPRPSNPG